MVSYFGVGEEDEASGTNRLRSGRPGGQVANLECHVHTEYILALILEFESRRVEIVNLQKQKESTAESAY